MSKIADYEHDINHMQDVVNYTYELLEKVKININNEGYISGSDHQRYGVGERWTRILAALLGNKFEIIEEGLNSRTLTSNDTRPSKEGKKWYEYLIPFAVKYKCYFLSNEGLETGIDGVHLTKESHKNLADRLDAEIMKF